MAASQTLQSAPNGTIWSRRVNGVTYFLRKINNSYEVWTSLASGSRSTVTLDQAVTYYNQYNLVNSNTATAASPAPRVRPAAPPPAPAPAPRTRPATPPPAPAASTTPTQAETPVTTPPTTTNPSLPISILDEESESLAVPVISEEELDTLVDTELDISSEESGEEPNDILVRGDRYLDWRVKLSLAPNSNYLYNAEEPGILAPLKETGGVIFPYTPQINIIYTANYEASSIVHTNYKVHQYSNSAVDSITLTCDFTAQDTREAIYLLSVIHFFRSVTKMFYGQDQNPRAGTPPPLCYIKGMGAYQFAEHPIAITTFTYNLPQDVDYIEVSGSALTGLALPANPLSNLRLPPGVLPGGRPAPPRFTNSPVDQYLPVTRVPTKMQIQLSAIPVISRGDMAEGFSLEEYALGSIYTTGQFW